MHPSIHLCLLILFGLGLYWYVIENKRLSMESFTSSSSIIPDTCPNLLVQKGTMYYLYNSKQPQVPGINPLIFSSLGDYTQFLKWQRSNGIRCPVLYVQHSYNTQNESVYTVRPSTTDLQGGLPPISTSSSSSEVEMQPNGSMTMTMAGGSNSILDSVNDTDPVPSTLLIDASHDNQPFNVNEYPGFDPTSFYVGKKTPLEQMDGTKDNPMSDNWLGPEYTQQLVDAGYYRNSNVAIYVPP